MKIETCKEEIEKNGVPASTKDFFDWAFRGLKAMENPDITPKGFAFRLMDTVSGIANSEAIMRSIINDSKKMGILPWENVSGLRLQASSCLAKYLEKKLV